MTRMRDLLVCALTVGLAVGCGKKADDPKPEPGKGNGEAAGNGAAGGGGTPNPQGASGGPVRTAEGGEVSSAPTVTACPRSLAGPESVNRVITKECGVVVVTEDYHLNNGSLTLEAGATLAFKPGAALNIGYSDSSKLIVKGTAEAPVRMTAAGDKVAGAWRGVFLLDHADRSSIDHLIVEYAGQGEDDAAIRINAQDVTLIGSTVRGSKGRGIALNAKGSLTKFENNTFEDIAKEPISLNPVAAGKLGGGNKFPPGSVIHVYNGTITKDVKWSNPGAPLWIGEQVHVDGHGTRATLEIGPGTEQRMGPEASLHIGYSNAAAIKAVGTKEAPVLFTTVGEKKPGAWVAIKIHASGEGTFEHAVFEYGGKDDDGALDVDGVASVKSSIFRHYVIGVSIGNYPKNKPKVFVGNSFSGSEKAALAIRPFHLGTFGKNTFADKENILVYSGRIEDNATWLDQGVPIELKEDIAVDGRVTLTVEPGVVLRMGRGTKIDVGYSENAAIRLMGTAEKPIRIEGVRDEAGFWRGVTLYNQSRDSVVQHVVIKNAGGDDMPGIDVREDATAKIDFLTCSGCKVAAVKWHCKAKVTAANVKAELGTPKGEIKPEGCQ
jgi:hypothetical protein